MTAPFVTFEGIEGSGKTTQIRLLSRHLGTRGIPHVLTREPGGTPLADEIRGLLLSHRGEPVQPETEILLYEAARAQHVRAVILPALASGRAVLCDRFCDATVAYQEFMRGIDGSRVAWLNAFAAAGLVPGLTFILDIPPEDGALRIRARGGPPDRIESESFEAHRKVREGYRALAGRHPERIIVIDGTLSEEAVAGRIREAVAGRFGW